MDLFADSIPISFDIDGTEFSSPLVAIEVSGVSAWCVVDSGASDHVLDVAFVERTSGSLFEEPPGTDHGGFDVESWAVSGLEIQLANRTFSHESISACRMPQQFEALNIAGILSPHALKHNGFVVLDLTNRFWLFVADAAAVVQYMKRVLPEVEPLTVARVVSTSFAVSAAIDPFPAVPTTINTGTDTTEFSAAAVPGLVFDANESVGTGLSGASFSGSIVKDQLLRLGSAQFKLPTLVVREQMPPPPGMIGMDLLDNSVIAFSHDADQPFFWSSPLVG